MKMPKSNFWKFDASWGNLWDSRGVYEESQKILPMSRNELIDYVKDLLLSPPEASDISNLFQYLSRRQIEDGSGHIYRAEDLFVAEMTRVFIDLRSRLKKMNVVNVYDNDDFKNIEMVMDGNISSPDYTALFLVHRYMDKNQTLEITKQQNEIQKFRCDFQDFWHRFEACIGRKLGYYPVIPIN